MFFLFIVLYFKIFVHLENKFFLPSGFVGFFSTTLLWPGFFIFHYSKLELFEWPSDKQWMFLAISGMVGTALTEILWIWYVVDRPFLSFFFFFVLLAAKLFSRS